MRGLGMVFVVAGLCTAQDAGSGGCEVTRPNGNTPRMVGSLSGANHGNGKLWTGLWPEGKVVFKPAGPGFIDEKGAMSMKFWWWRGVEGKLAIEGRRLDGAAPPLLASIPGGYQPTGFQATALIFPTEGCWEVTGRVGEEKLRVVMKVVREGHSPASASRLP